MVKGKAPGWFEPGALSYSAIVIWLSVLYHNSQASQRPRDGPRSGVCPCGQHLLGCQFLGFAFLAHQLQFALRLFVCRGHFLLHAGSRFFELG